VTHKHVLPVALATLLLTSCSLQVSQIGAATPTPFIITATLPPTLTPRPTDSPHPPPPTPTTTPVEGISSTQINVRAEPSTAGTVLGILPPNTKVQIVGQDPAGNWWQILYPQGDEGKGWVTAQYFRTADKPEVPIIGGVGSNPENGTVAVIQQKLNIRSGPGTDFNSIGTLNSQDVVTLTGKDTNGAWLQISFAAGPEGKGWINAAFAQATGVENLPIVTDTGQVVGTETPADTPLPPTPTVVPAPMDNDSAESPGVDVVFSAAGTHSIQFTGDVSAPTGDSDDWIRFISYTAITSLQLTCTNIGLTPLELLSNDQPVPTAEPLTCNQSAVITTNPGQAYLLHIQAAGTSDLRYTQYTIKLAPLP